jgi:hypothetical protein
MIVRRICIGGIRRRWRCGSAMGGARVVGLVVLKVRVNRLLR